MSRFQIVSYEDQSEVDLTSMLAEYPEADYSVILAPGSVVKGAAVAIDAGRRIGVEVVPIVRKD